MIVSLVKKELRVLLSDFHGLAVLFLMPMLFLIIMSLALPTSEINKNTTLMIYDAANSKHSSFLIETLKQSNKFNLISVQANYEYKPGYNNCNTNKISAQYCVVILKSFNDYISNRSEKNEHFNVFSNATLNPQSKGFLNNTLSIAASQTRLRQVLIDMELLNQDDSTLEQISSVKQASRLPVINYPASDVKKIPNATEQSLPAWLIFGMFFIVLPLSNTLITEKNSNTLARIKSFDINARSIIIHKLIPYIFINKVQFTLLLLTTIFIIPLIGGEPISLNNPLYLYIILSFSLSVAAVGMGMLIAVYSQTSEQAMIIGGGLNLILAALGGVMVPEYLMSDTMQQVSSLSPMNWGLSAFHQLLLQPSIFPDIALSCFSLLIFGLSMLTISHMVFKRQYRNLGWK